MGRGGFANGTPGDRRPRFSALYLSILFFGSFAAYQLGLHRGSSNCPLQLAPPAPAVNNGNAETRGEEVTGGGGGVEGDGEGGGGGGGRGLIRGGGGPLPEQQQQQQQQQQQTSRLTYDNDNGSAHLVLSPARGVADFAAANLGGSDKVKYHNYHVMYGPVLAPFMRKPVRLLEIGVSDGKSLKLWGRMFPNHEHIAGIGYWKHGFGKAENGANPFKRNLTDKHVLYTGSQADAGFLGKVLADLGGHKFDIIIDDGSHIPWHQIFTLETIFDTFLKEGGVYVIEDIETSYWDKPGVSLYGYPIPNAGIGKQGSAVEKLKGIADVLNRGVLLDPSYSILHGNVDHLMSHITFSQNCIMIHKKDQEQWKHAEQHNIQNYHRAEAAAYKPRLDPSRRDYRRYKATSNWEVSGMNRMGA
eukprot:CAMPEP_0197614178 /NCGR_PEP_ID=MMETSP1326-20131121/59392_1 /TAXON_ID=1155430 /ORGANISM="Genus nov. species nov., Strain RCC2288" /LENGTH=414 /DNA_ID=CAMNT_0043183047 /DNA_START=164 /DNA_END=1408 /DNA_ORIENTATION=-